ncbi:MAG: helix-turn-helix transcriptional regulator [Verrucomicrobia bacterium]|nr:helix-turn-helix transcriptional regulator [Verrucomicrobiota bacterium]
MDSANHYHRYSARIALGRRLKDWRLKGNRKISEVAHGLGVSTATWGHWETGEHLPSGELLLAIENLTCMPLQMLFCPHLDTCPQAGTGLLPTPGTPCCQQGMVPSGPGTVPDHQAAHAPGPAQPVPPKA